MLTNEEIEVAKKIGLFYFEKNNSDYDKTYQELLDLQITDLHVIDNWMVITTARPGILIGKRGQNIDALSKYVTPLKIKIVEAAHSFPDIMMPHIDYGDDIYTNWEEMIKDTKEPSQPNEGSCYDDQYDDPFWRRYDQDDDLNDYHRHF